MQGIVVFSAVPPIAVSGGPRLGPRLIITFLDKSIELRKTGEA